jgi:hypothetical protein
VTMAATGHADDDRRWYQRCACAPRPRSEAGYGSGSDVALETAAAALLRNRVAGCSALIRWRGRP